MDDADVRTRGACGKAASMYYSGNISSGSPIIEGADDQEATLALALRLMGRGFSDDESPTRLLVGRLPDPLPVALPLPNGARVVGSQVLGAVATIVLDVDLPEAQVLAFYRDRLEADGWTVPEQAGMHGGGFAFAPLRFAPALTYCRSTRGPSLSVQATAVAGGPTDVRLTLNTAARHSPCAPHQRHGVMRDFLPVLTPPAGVRQTPEGGGGGSNGYHSNATLRTDLDPAAVAAHYAGQLRAAGWASRGEGQDGAVAWSTWAFRDEDGEEWTSLLFALRQPEVVGEYVLYLRADASAGAAASGGWTSSTF